jgi:inosose dehydratase
VVDYNYRAQVWQFHVETSSTIRIASAPTCFGVQRVLPAGAWKPEPSVVLNAVADVGYEGIALGPPGYLGDASTLRQRLLERGILLAEAFLPFQFSRNDLFQDERAALAGILSLLSEATTVDARPVAVLSDGFLDPTRWAHAGRIQQHPEAKLPPERFPILMSNIHRAAEDCIRAGFQPVLHHHAGTFIETDDEIRRVVEAMDPALIGLCLDTGHAFIGGADPARLADDYHQLLRHVHLKDALRAVVARSEAESLSFTALTVEGAFCPLGAGDAGIAGVAAILLRNHYEGWVVVEQDRILFEEGEFHQVVDAQRENRRFLQAIGLAG